MQLRIVVSVLLLSFLSASQALAEWPISGTIAGSGRSQANPALVADGSGGSFLAWGQHEDASVSLRLSHYRRDGDLFPGWPDGGLVVASAVGFDLAVLGDDVHPDITIGWIREDDDGTHHFTHHFGLQRYTRTGNVAPGWPGDGIEVPGFAGFDPGGLALVPDARGGAFLLITAFGPRAQARTGVQHVDARGDVLWPAPKLLSETFGSGATAAPDGRGGVFVTWIEGSPAGVQLQDLDANGNPARGWPVGGIALTPRDGRTSIPRVVSDEHGGVFVTWREPAGMRALRIGADGTVAAGWNPAGTLVTTLLAHAYQTVADGDGGVIMGYLHFRAGIIPDVRVQRVTAGGEALWGPQGTTVCAAEGIRDFLALAPDWKGGVWAAWSDGRYGDPQYLLFLSHVLAAGTIATSIPEDGLLLADGAGPIEFKTQLVYDRGADPIASWEDRTTATGDATVRLKAVEVPDAPEPVVTGKPVLRLDGSEATLEVEAASAGPAHVELFDLAGRKLASRDLAWTVAGGQRVNLPAMEGLKSGVYFVRVSHAGRVETARVALLH